MASSSDIKAGGAYVEVRAPDDAIKRDLASISHLLDHTKKQFGEDSNFGKSMKMLQGAGVVAGLTLATQTLAKVSAKAVDLRNELAIGAKTGGQVAIELGKSLPIIGGIVETGENLHELFTGEQAAIAAANKELSQMDQFMATVKKQAADTKAIFDGWQKTINGARREADMMFAVTDADRQIKQIEYELKDKIEGHGKQAESDRKTIEGNITELVKQRNAIVVPPDPGPAPSEYANSGYVMGDAGLEGSWRDAKAAHDRAISRQRLIQKAITDQQTKLAAVDKNRDTAIGLDRQNASDAITKIKVERELSGFDAGVMQGVEEDQQAADAQKQLDEKIGKSLDDIWDPIVSDWKRKGEEMRKALETPGDAFRNRMTEIEGLVNLGEISRPQAVEATSQALRQLETDRPGTGAIDFDLAGIQAAVDQAAARTYMGVPPEAMKSMTSQNAASPNPDAREQTNLQKQMVRSLQRIERAGPLTYQ